MRIFIASIDTNVGKTIVSSIICEALKADYWKPIQAGNLEESDSLTVKNLISNNITHIHKEAYKLSTPCSPHKAAKIDNIKIEPDKISIPLTENNLIIEGAGGIMTPITDNFLFIDLIKKLNTPVILISKNYLGSINHTLLSLEILKLKNIKIIGIIFNQGDDIDSENYITKYTGIPIIAKIPKINNISKESIFKIADSLSKSFSNIIK